MRGIIQRLLMIVLSCLFFIGADMVAYIPPVFEPKPRFIDWLNPDQVELQSIRINNLINDIRLYLSRYDARRRASRHTCCVCFSGPLQINLRCGRCGHSFCEDCCELLRCCVVCHGFISADGAFN